MRLLLVFKILLLLAVISLSACAPTIELRIPGDAIPLSFEESEELDANLNQQAEQVKSMRGLARAKIASSDGEATNLRYAILIEAPDKIRLEALPTIGSYSLHVLAGQADKVSLVDFTERSYMTRADSSELVGRLLGIRLDAKDLLLLLLGTVPDICRTEHEKQFFVSEKQSLYAKFGDACVAELNTDFRPVTIALKNKFDSTESLRLEYLSWQAGIPEELNLSAKILKIELKFTKLDLNPILNPKLFTIKIPANFREQ